MHTAGAGRRGGGLTTMQDVAMHVGVSTKSVSRVLNGEGGVSASTAERILTAARELGFRRNDLARDLARGQRTRTVGLVLRHASTRFYGSLIRGIDEVAAAQGVLVLTAASRTAEGERTILQSLASRRVDGVLVVPVGEDQSYLRQEQQSGLAVVFVDRPPVGVEADTVLADDRAGGRLAAAHLLAHGHRRVGVVGARARLHTVAERVAGSADAHTAAGLEPDPALRRLGADSPEAAQAAVEDLLSMPEPPTALFTLNTVCTVGALRALARSGLTRSVALVGHDDFDIADLLDPPVTVVAHDVVELGRLAASRLFARVAGHDGPPALDRLASELVVRGSGELLGPHA